jgi:hypothetical protein
MKVGWRVAGWSAGVTALLVLVGRTTLVSDLVCPDFIEFWAAGKLLASGRSPYDTELQARVQQEQGWDLEKRGLGFYPFLPFYYPP